MLNFLNKLFSILGFGFWKDGLTHIGVQGFRFNRSGLKIGCLANRLKSITDIDGVNGLLPIIGILFFLRRLNQTSLFDS